MSTVARVTEISAESESSSDDAIKVAVDRASQTLRGVTGAWVKEQEVQVRDGRIASYKVNCWSPSSWSDAVENEPGSPSPNLLVALPTAVSERLGERCTEVAPKERVALLMQETPARYLDRFLPCDGTFAAVHRQPPWQGTQPLAGPAPCHSS